MRRQKKTVVWSFSISFLSSVSCIRTNSDFFVTYINNISHAANINYVSTEVIGQSFEGEDLLMLKICTDGCNDEKPAVFINGGKLNTYSTK